MKYGAKRIWAAAFCLLTAIIISSCSSSSPQADRNSPTPVLIWHYYNGLQKQLFDQLVSKFNETVGEEKNIVVEAVNQGSINELAQKTLDALAHKVGAQVAPDVFSGYADTVYQALLQDKVVDIGAYLTAAEKNEFIEYYLQEGDLRGDGGIYIFPIAKATEVLFLNSTDWQRFASATGARESDLATWEGIGRLAEAYYRWTDSLTETPEDGKAFFGRDAMANYLLVGCAQLGQELFAVRDGKASLHADKSIIRRLWDNYYVPYINGYFASFGRFRSDDVKTGDLIALVGSTSGAVYFPTEVTLADGSTYPIEAKVYPAPGFEGTTPFAVQQGAGMAIVKSNPKTEAAAVTFLKWFTDREQNNVFSQASGYMPVKRQSIEDMASESAMQSVDNPVARDVLRIGLDMSKTYTLFAGKPFRGGNEVRDILEKSLQDKAAADRRLVLEQMSRGVSREEAVANINTEANFQQWYSRLIRYLESASSLRPREIKPRYIVE